MALASSLSGQASLAITGQAGNLGGLVGMTGQATLALTGSATLVGVAWLSGQSTTSTPIEVTAARILSLLEADEVHTPTQVKKLEAGTSTVLLTKNHSGVPLTSFQAVE